jgi:hypothetical protein
MRLKAEKMLFDVFACRQMRLPASLRHVTPCMKRKPNKPAARWMPGLKMLKAISIRQPTAFREYVIVHELLHLKVPNHGKLFKSLLRAYIPNYELIKPQAAQSNTRVPSWPD